MFIIYNETKSPWVRESRRGVEFLTKSRKYNRQGKEIEDAIGIITYSNMVNSNIKELDTYVFDEQPHTIITKDVDTSVQFNKKEFNPFVSEGSKLLKDVYLISLDLKGRKIVGLSESMILDKMLLGGEFSAIIAVRPETSLKIYLVDEAKNEKISYVFKSNSKGIIDVRKLSKIRTEAEAELVSNFKPKKFRPAICTNTILVSEDNYLELLKVMGEDVIAKKHVFMYTDENIDKAIAYLKSDKIKAVTVFKSETVNQACCDAMGVVYNMDENKKIKKIKY